MNCYNCNTKLCKNSMRKIFISIAIIIILLIVNACYWLCSDIQTKCVNKIADNQELSLYEKGSILTLHLGICTIGSFYCSEAAYANFQMLITEQDTVYLHSNKWITPKIKKRFENNQLGKMAWNGDNDYALNSPEKDGAIDRKSVV